MNDTSIPPPEPPPCGRAYLRDCAWFIGETARPMSLALIGTGTVAGFLLKMGVAELTIMCTTLGALYGTRAVENVQKAKSGATA